MGDPVEIVALRRDDKGELFTWLLSIFRMSIGIFEEDLLMKIKYSSDADDCNNYVIRGIHTDSIDLKEGIILHLDQGGNPLKIEIIDASKIVSLDEVIFSLPTGRSSAITQYATN